MPIVDPLRSVRVLPRSSWLVRRAAALVLLVAAAFALSPALSRAVAC
jgi:uncharacterized protein involved in exopolysaccharide biosynthesis